jgi:hypothetical protein
MADKRTGKEGAIHLTPYDNILQQLRSCRKWSTTNFAGGVICTKIMMAGPTASQFQLICCTQL